MIYYIYRARALPADFVMALRATRPMNRRQLQRQSLPAVPRSRAFFAFRTVPERPAAGRRHPPPLLRKGGGRPLCGSPIDRLRCPRRGAASAQGGETIICEPPTAPPIQKAPFVLFDDVFVPSEALLGVRRYPRAANCTFRLPAAVSCAESKNADAWP